MKEVTEKIIKRGHRFSSLYHKGLSNHLPMAIYALDFLGGSDDQLLSFEELYTKQLEPIHEIFFEVKKINDHLGEVKAFTSLVRFFEYEIQSKGLKSVLQNHLPLLSPGISGAAFHPLIRLAFAIESEIESEQAHALASWVVAYQQLVFPNEPVSKFDPKESLENLRESFRDSSFKPTGFGVFRRMKSVSQSKEFQGFVDQIDRNKISIDTLAELAIKLYLGSNDDFTALHCVTSCHGLRLLADLCDLSESLLLDYMIAFGAAYVDVGIPVIKDVKSPEKLPAWEEIFQVATTSKNDHLIKLVYTCRQEQLFYDNDLYHLAAAKKVGIFSSQ